MRGFVLRIAFPAMILSLVWVKDVSASKAWDTELVWIRVNGTSFQVEIDTTGKMTEYNDDEDCKDSSHVTTLKHPKTSTRRFFNHIHASWTTPINGTKGKDTYTVNIGASSNVRAHWDWVYAGYTTNGTENLSVNCHGYAFDYNTWPQIVTLIHEADLDDASGWSDTKFLVDAKNYSQHTIWLMSIVYGTFYDDETKWERCQISRAYGKVWGVGVPTKADGGAVNKKKWKKP